MPDEFAFIAGLPGTGKIARLTTIRDRYETADYRVIGMAGTTMAQQNLHHRGFGNATTIAADALASGSGSRRYGRSRPGIRSVDGSW
jgi:hypothetical protein